MLILKCFRLITILMLCVSVASDSNKKLISLDEKYKSAVKAYTADQWSECIRHFEDVIHINKLYNAVVANCGQRCKEITYEPIVKDKIEDLRVYELYLRQSACLEECKEKSLKDLNVHSEVSDEVKDYLSALEPYNYIHLCYFKMNLLPNAAVAAFTYLVAHPDDTLMKNNFEYYIRQPEVNEDDVIDLESDDYKFLYWQGALAYQKKQWADTVNTMEEVLDDYIASENKCRLFCEENNKHRLHAFDNLASYFKFLLNCKQKCQNSVKSLGFESGILFLADVLNYIQIGYYYLDAPNKAARAVESYLLLLPEDEEMLENKKIYTVFVEDDAFIEKPEIAFYHKRDMYEKRILKYFHTPEDGSRENIN